MYSFEKLEPRILLSADLAPLVTDPQTIEIDEAPDLHITILDNSELSALQEDTSTSPPSPDITAVPTLPSTKPSEIIFINDDVEDPEALINDNNLQDDQKQVIILDSSVDGIKQITDILAANDSIDALHFITHGTEGTVKLGKTWLNADNLSGHSQSIASWGVSLSTTGDILFYGCDLASDISGQKLINEIADLTSADLAASTDSTGHASFGGDWVLEYQLGEIEAKIPFSLELQNNWLHVLAEETVSDDFSTGLYDNNTGTKDWVGDWVEIGESTDPTQDNVLIDNGRISIHTADYLESTRGIKRTVDLSSANTAYLSFDYEALPIENNSGHVSLQIHPEGDAYWYIIGNYWTDWARSDSVQIDITSYKSAATEIRFISSTNSLIGGHSWGNDNFYLDNVQIDYSTLPSPLWLTTDKDVSSGGQLGTSTWNKGDFVGVGSPNLTFGTDTSGTFSIQAEMSSFTAGKDISALHYVSRDIQIGSSNFQLLEGDILFASTDAKASDFGGVDAQEEDIVLFRPTTEGDYSSGTFQILFSDLTGGGDEIRGITLIEQDVNVGGKSLNAGDLLFLRSGGEEDQIVWLYETGDVEPGSGTTGTISVLLDGHDTGIDISENLYGIDLVEEDITIGGKVLNSGTILLSVDTADTIGTTPVEKYDIFALDVGSVSDPSGSTDIGTATASIFFDGSDVSFNQDNEKIDGFSLTVAPVQVPNTFTGGVFDAENQTITLTGTNMTFLGDIGENVKAHMDWSKFVWDVNGDDGLTTDISFIIEDISEVVVTNATTLTLTLTGAKTDQIVATSGYGISGGLDTLDIATGFSSNGSGGYSTTDGLSDGPLTTITPSVIGGDDTGSVTEDIDPNSNTLLETSGILTIVDPDVGGSSFVAETITGTYGTLIIDTAGQWSYEADNTQTLVQQLDLTETSTDVFTVTTTDGATHDVVITINGDEDAPTLDNLIGDKTATENTAFSFTFPADTFSDVDSSDILIYTATLSDDSALPGWLSFDAGSRTFSGTPTSGDVGLYNIKLTADDGSSTVAELFDILVDSLIHAPSITGTATGDITEDLDPDSDTLLEISGMLNIVDLDAGESSFIAETIGGNYGSLTINAIGQWNYQADNTQSEIQQLDIGESITDTISVTTADGTTKDIVITINGAEDTPTLDNAIADQIAAEDVLFSFTVPLNSFSDVDLSDTLSYTATLDDDSSLPTWLNFDAATRTFSGTPDNGDVGAIDVKITATDVTGTVSDTFTLTVNNTDDIPAIAGDETGSVTEDLDPDSDSLLETGGVLTISDPDVGESSFVAETIGGSYGSLTIDATGQWSYQADNTQTGVQQLDLSESLTDTFTVTTADGTTHDIVITVNGAEDTPTLDNAIADQIATEDVDFSLTVPLSTFSDVDLSDTLSYTATLDDDSPLPTWLNFDAATRTFSGTPDNGDVGTIDVKVTATDGTGTVSDNFSIAINNAPVVNSPDPIEITPGVLLPDEITPDITPTNPPEEPDATDEETNDEAEEPSIATDLEPLLQNSSTESEGSASLPVQTETLNIDFSLRNFIPSSYTAALAQSVENSDSFSDFREKESPLFAVEDYDLLNLDYQRRSTFEYDTLKHSLDAFREETEQEAVMDKTIVGSAIAASTGLSAGYVVWLLRSGALLSSILSSLPAWQLADPLAVLAGGRRQSDEEGDDSIEAIIAGSSDDNFKTGPTPSKVSPTIQPQNSADKDSR